MIIPSTRREFLQTTGNMALAGMGMGLLPATSQAQPQLPQPELPPRPEGIEVINPAGRVPLSFIIDDSTCLVNLGHFCTPQFATVYPHRKEYQRDWRSWPREIPDAFVRDFGEWCSDHGVKGKYSIVPNPACVGWVDRVLPGWTRRQLTDSLDLVRTLLLPNWDIHPEMITHTRVIDLNTGRPLEEISEATMENSYPRQKKSVDELAAYLAYALRILKNAGLPCEGVTTPGGFGNLVKLELSLAVQQAVRDVYDVEIPHYFKYVHNKPGQSVEPIIEHLSGLDTDDIRLTVNVPCGTGDWFGSWQGVETPDGDKYANRDATSGRMVELIEQGGPAIMLCHWQGMYCNGTRVGYEHFQNVVTALEGRFRQQTIWMKVSEIARYWAAKQLTRIETTDDGVRLTAPFAAQQFTLRMNQRLRSALQLQKPGFSGGDVLKEVTQAHQLRSGTWYRDNDSSVLCFDLPQGESTLVIDQ